jgi:indolepyruvate ferredoxin oxidoreductase beta subunit
VSEAANGRVISVLIPAVGGQGGGVLSEWIVEAALCDGYPAQATSIPGVAQRTGSTTYLIEVFNRRRDELDGAEPVFSLFAVPGALDVLLAPELLEVGRAIEAGFASPSRTTIITSTHRLFSIHEKITTGGSMYPREVLEEATRRFSRRSIGFDALALARANATEPNAVLLGALAASGELPISPEAFRRAIEAKGVQVPVNLKGFDLGYALVQKRADAVPAKDSTPSRGRPEFAGECARYPEPLRFLIADALHRLVDYQDRAYASRYQARLQPFVDADQAPYTLSLLVARHLAVWMTYEDAIRVADLKTRAARFHRIRSRTGASRGQVVVTDFLKPDLDELYGILPYQLVRPFAEWAERRWPHGRPTVGQHVKSTTISGFLRLWILSRLRRWRPLSYRAHREHAVMEAWLNAVSRCAQLDYRLGCEVARAAALVKGYGEVRRRLTAAVRALLSAVSSAATLDPAAARELAERCHALIRRGPDGEAEAVAEAERTLQDLRSAAGISAAHEDCPGSG